MASIQELLRLRPNTYGDIGIEIEMEGENLPIIVNNEKYWKVVNDPSLRGESREYVYRNPLNLTDVKASLDDLRSSLIRSKANVFDSYRAGTHVHINCQDLSPKQIITFALCYLILEDIFFDWLDPRRKGNHFCLTASEADYLLSTLVDAITSDNMSILNTDKIRYSSCNFKSLFKWGTLEFRAMESTLDFDKIEMWASILYNIKIASMEYENPIRVIEDVSGIGYRDFVVKMLGDNFAKYDWLKVGWEDKICNGVRNAQDIAYVRDWDRIDLNIFKANKGQF